MTPTLDPRYVLANPDQIATPSLAVYPEIVRENIARAVRQAGGADRLRPHAKTHKTMELTALELAAGVTKHKCATIAEAELLARAGAVDVLVAYPLVGPNCRRLHSLQRTFPGTQFSFLLDHPDAADSWEALFRETGDTVDCFLDVDVGMGRTGVAPEAVRGLYERLSRSPAFRARGLHVYDGHTNQNDAEVRASQVDAIWSSVRGLVAELEGAGLPVPTIVCGGTGSFSRWAEIARDEPKIELSPGTIFLNDWGYFSRYADLAYQPAAVLLTRVVSKPRPGRLTLDLGSKAVAPDSAAEMRAKILDLPDAHIVGQSEEHLVVETSKADQIPLGRLLYAWPHHICPTCALHSSMLVVEEGRVVGEWKVAARDRMLTV